MGDDTGGLYWAGVVAVVGVLIIIPVLFFYSSGASTFLPTDPDYPVDAGVPVAQEDPPEETDHVMRKLLRQQRRCQELCEGPVTFVQVRYGGSTGEYACGCHPVSE